MAKQSLASRGSTALATLPETQPIVVVPPDVQQSSYVTFVHPSAKVYSKLAQCIPGVDLDDTVLILPEPRRPLKLAPMRFMLLAAMQYWAQFDEAEFTPTKTRLTPPEDGQKRAWKEQIESVVLIVTADRLYPASMLWKSTKCGPFHRANDALKLAGDPEEWGKQSPDHALTCGVPVVWARFVAQVKLGKKTTSKTSGYTYTPATSLIYPTTASELKLVTESFDKDTFRAELAAVQSRYTHRLEDVKRLAE